MTDLSREQLLQQIAALEADNDRLVKHIRRANDQAKRSGEYAIQVGEYRDEAWKERDQLRAQVQELQGRIDKARALPLIDIECERHGSVCYANNECPESGKVVDAQQLWAALDGGGEARDAAQA